MAKKNSQSQPENSSGSAPPAPARASKPRRRRASEQGSDPQPSPTAAETSTSAAISTFPGVGDSYSADASRAASRPDSMSSRPSEEAIRMRAYERYLERGGGHGLAFDDWLAAEQELNKR